MNNSKTLFQDFLSQITLNEDKAEIISLAHLVFDRVLGISKTDLLSQKHIQATTNDLEKLDTIVKRINQHEPIQYILGEADFFGRRFKVNASVLIPRPETEELVREVKNFSHPAAVILDIGTGSGCIPITLALEISGAKVSATDVSDKALMVAKENAKNLGAAVHFLQHNILTEEIPFRDLDIVVSNPPYIALSEKESMAPNVKDFEPHLALFVSENDPLLFYRVIAAKAQAALKSGGLLCVEINERFGERVKELFQDEGFGEVTVIRDLSGKERIVRGIK
jgi:release factor glutamine methyltransferase